MKNTTLQLIEDLDIQLKLIDKNTDDPFTQAQTALGHINQCLLQLKMVVESTLIQSIQDEIWLFKTAKPLIVSKKLYFSKHMEISTHQSQSDKRTFEAYLRQQLSMVNNYYSENSDFCRYINENLTCLDDRYFVRGNKEMHLCIDEKWRDPFPEPFFATSHDYLLAMLIANNALKKHLQTEIERYLEN